MRAFPASNKQMKVLATFLALPLLAAAAILPDDIGPYHRTATTQPALQDRALWGEYGIKEWEAATYQNGKDRLAATVWQLGDSTGALGAYDWQAAGADMASKSAPLAAETKNSLLLVHGNYLLRFEGYKPSKEELEAIYGTLKNVDNTALPVLMGYLPLQNLAPHSERYVLGPVGLERFDPGIPPSVAAFHFGAEAQIGMFQSPRGPVELAIFNYPTAQIARQKVGDFEKLPGSMAKRSGPLVAVVLSPVDADFAERLLGEVRYQADVTRDEYVPTRRDNPGVLILNIFILIGILVLFALVSGFAFGGFRLLRRKARQGEEPDAMITLHLSR
jgi:hypothetical protein